MRIDNKVTYPNIQWRMQDVAEGERNLPSGVCMRRCVLGVGMRRGVLGVGMRGGVPLLM